jgi:hypothetical protein
MNQTRFDVEVKEIAGQLPLGPRIGIIGSSSLWGEDSGEICEAIGNQLGAIPELVLLTGGVPGVGERVGRSFFERRQQLSLDPCTYHILPRGSGSWDYGVTLYGGESMMDRREILGRLARIYLVIEGGPGTVHEASIAHAAGATVVPVGRTGGCSRNIYLDIPCPSPRLESEWQLLNDEAASIERIGVAANRIVRIQLGLDV